MTIECKASEMVAQISTSTVFNGKVYARTRPNSCVEDITNSTSFNISLPYNSVTCDVVQNGNANFAANIVIQVSGLWVFYSLGQLTLREFFVSAVRHISLFYDTLSGLLAAYVIFFDPVSVYVV